MRIRDCLSGLRRERLRLPEAPHSLAWAERLGYSEVALADALEVFEVLRAANVRLLRRLAPADWERVAVHAERGEESVRQMARLFAGHDLLHLRQIERIRRAHS